MIEFRQPHFLEAIIDYGSFRQASVALGVEQSALSPSIAKLERVLSMHLVVRSRPGATATAARTALIRSSRQLIAIADRMLAQSRLAEQGRIGTLTIGHNNSISARDLREMIESY